jgi:calcineurin-like phosphoesterase family protein
MRFITSDEHYGHRNIIKFCKRPFADIYEMREALIAAHNAKVQPGDLTFHLGDIFWKHTSAQEALDILSRLNGDHVLILGNHDELVRNTPEIWTRFVQVEEVMLLPKYAISKKLTLPKMFLHHYAGRVWPDSHKGSYHFYGHSHAALPEANTLSCDIGVDTRPDYAPWSELELHVKMQAKKAAGAKDEMTAEIEKNPWDKAEDAEVLYPAPQAQAAWEALKALEENQSEHSVIIDEILGRCVE